MMHPSEIVRRSREAAVTAAKKNKVPYVPFDKNDIEASAALPFPFLGDYVPKEWEIATDADGEPISAFVDMSGFGSPLEPALTLGQLKSWLLDNLDRGYGYAFTEVGQFQGILHAYKKKGTKK